MSRVRVLVVYGSAADEKELSCKLVEALTREGVGSEACAAEDVDDLEAFDAVAVGGAREGGRWQRFAREFARRHASELRNLPALFLGNELDRERLHVLARAIVGRLPLSGISGSN